MTVSLRLDQELSNRLDALAEQTGRSKSDLLRESLKEYLERNNVRPSAWELGKHLFGKVGSGRSDLSINSEQILREKLRGRTRRP